MTTDDQLDQIDMIAAKIETALGMLADECASARGASAIWSTASGSMSPSCAR